MEKNRAGVCAAKIYSRHLLLGDGVNNKILAGARRHVDLQQKQSSASAATPLEGGAQIDFSNQFWHSIATSSQTSQKLSLTKWQWNVATLIFEVVCSEKGLERSGCCWCRSASFNDRLDLCQSSGRCTSTFRLQWTQQAFVKKYLYLERKKYLICEWKWSTKIMNPWNFIHIFFFKYENYMFSR